MMEDKSAILDIIHNRNLLGFRPGDVLLWHGPTKQLVDNYHWHAPDAGIVASYSPKARDVQDHFGVFRGVDQVEAFTQALIVSCITFSECRKNNCTPEELKKKVMPAFISIGNVTFHSYVEQGDTFICIGNITFYRWRQMVADGRIYKAPPNLNLDDYFSGFTVERLLKYDISEDFKLAAELNGITGRTVLNELFKKKE
jgi:hypothetical protein